MKTKVRAFWEVEFDKFKSYEDLTLDDIKILRERIRTEIKELNKDLEALRLLNKDTVESVAESFNVPVSKIEDYGDGIFSVKIGGSQD